MPTATPTPMPKGVHVPVTVPNVVGMTQGQAEQVLASAGFTVRIVSEGSPSGQHVPAGLVWSQNPPAGSVVAKGTIVTLDVQP
jgi:beta-lactam-binding protein with PASTA domain